MIRTGLKRWIPVPVRRRLRRGLERADAVRRVVDERLLLFVWDRFARHRDDAANEVIHLINPLRTLGGGGPLRTVHLYEELRRRRAVIMWSEARSSAIVTGRYPVRRIVPRRREFPRGGTIVIVGSYFRIGAWLRYSRPRRVILVHNNNLDAHAFRRLITDVSRAAGVPVEVVYASEYLRAAGGYPGHVERSLIDIDRFSIAAERPPTRSFTVGRLSRSEAKKHHRDDAALYRSLAEAGMLVRIMGASSELAAELRDVRGITLVDEWSEAPERFLLTLDCFVYRTSEAWPEPWGRVVIEAMASGLPVVCDRRGGYAEVVEHGRNGFLFETNEEAIAIVSSLRDDVGLRARVGAAARRTVEELFAPERLEQLAGFYLR